jgi:hypothetical protein
MTTQEPPEEHDVERAVRIARLWRAGKMIGGDEDEVRDTLLAEVERLRAAHEPCPDCTENENEAREANVRTDKVAKAIRDSMPQVIRGVVEQFGQYIVHGTPGHYGWLPEDHAMQHNCDAMACGQDHALARFPIERAAQPPEDVLALLREARPYLESFASLTKHPTAARDANLLRDRIVRAYSGATKIPAPAVACTFCGATGGGHRPECSRA